MKGILLANFGTSHPDSREKTYGAIAREAGEKWPGLPLYSAVTSGKIRKKMARSGQEARDVPSALRQMAEEGVTEALVLPTFVIGGIEYEHLAGDCRAAAPLFRSLTLAPPLLDRPASLEQAAKAVLAHQGPLPEGTVLVLLGHGTDHQGDFAYPALEAAFRELGRRDVLVGTVEGYLGLESVCRRLGERHPRPERVVLRPFLITAGDHVKNDMAGEEAGSWRSVLTGEGYAVECVLEGLGEIPAIREMLLAPTRRSAP